MDTHDQVSNTTTLMIVQRHTSFRHNLNDLSSSTRARHNKKTSNFFFHDDQPGGISVVRALGHDLSGCEIEDDDYVDSRGLLVECQDLANI
jgi:hypothetical protein